MIWKQNIISRSALVPCSILLGPAASILVRCVDIYIFFFSNVVSLYFFHWTRLVCVDGALACDATPTNQSNVTIAATVEASSSLSACRVLLSGRSHYRTALFRLQSVARGGQRDLVVVTRKRSQASPSPPVTSKVLLLCGGLEATLHCG